MNRRIAALSVALLIIVSGLVAYLRRTPTAATVPSDVPTKAQAEAHCPPVPLPPEEAALQTVEGKDASYEERMDAVHKLGRNLAPEQVERLRTVMNTPGVEAPLRNDAYEALAAQSAVPAGLVNDLVSGWQNDTNDTAWKDFTLQHLVTAYEHATAAEQALALTTLEDAAAKHEGASRGTALLSLQRIAERHPELAPKVDELRRQVGGADPDTQAAALQLALDAKDTSVLPQARAIAADEGAQVRLRLAAVGVLGQLGEASDVETLTALAQHKDDRLRRAAGYQLAELQKRLK